MIVTSLQSGSNGNCIYVESGDVGLLFDAGISGKQAQLRLMEHQRDISRAEAVILSHDHADHARCAGVYQRKFGLPIYTTRKTIRTAAGRYRLGRIDDVRYFKPGTILRFGQVSVQTIPTPHDGVDGVAFVVDDGRDRLGILTDLGHVFPGLKEVIGSLDAVVIESNYDPHMLIAGPYPAFIKRRIQGPGGHISNIEAAHLLRTSARSRMKWACLAHLSQQNNHPDLALRTHREILRNGLPLHVAGRYEATPILEV